MGVTTHININELSRALDTAKRLNPGKDNHVNLEISPDTVKLTTANSELYLTLSWRNPTMAAETVTATVSMYTLSDLIQGMPELVEVGLQERKNDDPQLVFIYGSSKAKLDTYDVTFMPIKHIGTDPIEIDIEDTPSLAKVINLLSGAAIKRKSKDNREHLKAIKTDIYPDMVRFYALNGYMAFRHRLLTPTRNVDHENKPISCLIYADDLTKAFSCFAEFMTIFKYQGSVRMEGNIKGKKDSVEMKADVHMLEVAGNYPNIQEIYDGADKQCTKQCVFIASQLQTAIAHALTLRHMNDNSFLMTKIKFEDIKDDDGNLVDRTIVFKTENTNGDLATHSLDPQNKEPFEIEPDFIVGYDAFLLKIALAGLDAAKITWSFSKPTYPALWESDLMPDTKILLMPMMTNK